MDKPELIPLSEVIEQHRRDPIFRDLWDLQMRMDRISEAHTPKPDAIGGVTGYCPECTLRHPCPTWVWSSTERDSLLPWDPNDDRDNDAGEPA